MIRTANSFSSARTTTPFVPMTTRPSASRLPATNSMLWASSHAPISFAAAATAVSTPSRWIPASSTRTDTRNRRRYSATFRPPLPKKAPRWCGASGSVRLVSVDRSRWSSSLAAATAVSAPRRVAVQATLSMETRTWWSCLMRWSSFPFWLSSSGMPSSGSVSVLFSLAYCSSFASINVRATATSS